MASFVLCNNSFSSFTKVPSISKKTTFSFTNFSPSDYFSHKKPIIIISLLKTFQEKVVIYFKNKQIILYYKLIGLDGIYFYYFSKVFERSPFVRFAEK